ncbi:DNA-binding protein [Arthrobacter sp. MYb211]|uniref:APC family permease n=1 Tax=unclassified Arthrobacter TaxID=235627 RepID=UPI000CFDC2AB|nr:DNA-binding protein [Arthrobacter sp. MYb224]PRA06382.1 DNA-binding protein [Arthrobacter sp. MYb229]PRA12682.1 DNA-binding protein [Arthrobacter sp. MYb221]PRB53284.1 DNA-binding protein [Arthrobacter sp. MYb216]PRC09798.1 DNA-binding protein [Arthrobacter sp. MYb211]
MPALFDGLKRILVGRPFSTEQLKRKPLPPKIALPIFSSSALSSLAYAPDEILLTLAMAGIAATMLSPAVGVAVLVVLLVLVLSYRQSVEAYPSGGGDYEIVRKNLGPRSGTTVASALLVDFVLTVAVSSSSAAQYLSGVFPALEEHRAWVASAIVAFLVVANLRGRGQGRWSLAIPVYLFAAGMLAMIAIGGVLALTGNLGLAPSAEFNIIPEQEFETGMHGVFGALLILRAFSTGSAALTGIEVPISNVHHLRKPRARNAGRILLVLGLLSGVLTLGTLMLARATGIKVVADPQASLMLAGQPIAQDYVQVPVLGQLAQAVFGDFFLGTVVVSLLTIAVLLLAGNQAFNSFPNLASHLAGDGYLPRQLRTRGDRLGFSNGILSLGAAAIVLILLFSGDVTILVQLYVVGVFVSFTLSQLGMLKHWSRVLITVTDRKVRAAKQRKRLLNLIGLILSLLVLVIVLATRFVHGAWLAVLGIVALTLIMESLQRHYQQVDDELAISDEHSATALPARVHALVLVSTVRKPVLRALAFARASRPSKLEAIIVDIEAEKTEQTLAAWDRLRIPVPITALASPYREIAGPLIEHIRSIKRESPRDLIVVYIPEYVVGHWWEQLVHNQTAQRVKNRLHYEPGVLIASVPWRLLSSSEALIGGPTEESSAHRHTTPHEG